jgi:hypothetical protein
MNSCKVAVCFSGQARHWRPCVTNIKRFFEAGHYNRPSQVDYFIHTWDTNTWRYYKRPHTEFENVKHNDEHDIRHAYNPKHLYVEEFKQEDWPMAWDPMFYSHMKSVQYKRNYEVDNKFEYDIVVKARMDTVYNTDVVFQPGHLPFYNMMAYTVTPITKFPREFHTSHFDDVLFYSDSVTMDLLGLLYKSHKQIHNEKDRQEQKHSGNLMETSYYGPGSMLYEHMRNIGIHPDCKTVVDYAVMRETSVKKNLDGLRDYPEIKKDWMDWYI